MKDYECVVIFAPTVGNDVLEGARNRYGDVITSRGGTLTEIDDWGKRSLAYEIKFHREGFYHLYKFKGDNEIVNELNRQLRIDENVIRHMIVRDEMRDRPQSATADEEVKEKTETRQAETEEGR